MTLSDKAVVAHQVDRVYNFRYSGIAKTNVQRSGVRCLSPNYGASEWHTHAVHTDLNSGRRYSRSSLWSNYLHNEGRWQRMIGLLVSHDRNRNPGKIITGGLDKVRGLKARTDGPAEANGRFDLGLRLIHRADPD
jgi:hypothetical protein